MGWLLLGPGIGHLDRIVMKTTHSFPAWLLVGLLALEAPLAALSLRNPTAQICATCGMVDTCGVECCCAAEHLCGKPSDDELPDQRIAAAGCHADPQGLEGGVSLPHRVLPQTVILAKPRIVASRRMIRTCPIHEYDACPPVPPPKA